MPVRSFQTLAIRYLLLVILLVLVFQAFAVGLDLASGSITDLWFALLPVLWVDIALIVLFLFSWGLVTGRGEPRLNQGVLGKWSSWLIPDFRAIRAALASGSLRMWILIAATTYGITFAILERMIVVDFSGMIMPAGVSYPFLDTFGGPVGWGPKVVWAPNPYFGILLRPYTVAATVLLSVLAGFGIGLVGYRWRARRGSSRSVRGAAGAAAGFLVMCPVCAGSPTLALATALLTPAAAEGGLAAGSLSGPLMVFSTAMLILSVVMLWVGIARASQGLETIAASLPTAGKLPNEVALRLRRWSLVASVVLAAGALLIDLSAASTSESQAGHGVAAAAIHPPAALALFMLGFIAVLTGVSVGPRDDSFVRRSALLGALALLYADGVIHWFAILEHIGSAPNVAFFLAVGAVQVLAVPITITRDRVLWWVGVPFTAFLIALFAVTRVVPPPFGLEPEPLEQIGLASKGIEVLLLASLGAYFGRRIVPLKWRGLVRKQS